MPRWAVWNTNSAWPERSRRAGGGERERLAGTAARDRVAARQKGFAAKPRSPPPESRMEQGQVATRGLGAGRGGAAPEIGRDDGARTGGMAWSQSARGWHEEDGAVRPRMLC